MMNRDKLLEMTDQISAKYIAEAKPVKTAARRSLLPESADGMSPAAEAAERADKGPGRIVQYITTGFAAAAALALVIGGGFFISRMNRPSVGNSGADSGKPESRYAIETPESSHRSDESSVPADAFVRGQKDGAAAVAAGKAEILLNGTFLGNVRKIYADPENDELQYLLVQPPEHIPVMLHLSKDIFVYESRSYVFRFRDGALSTEQFSMLYAESGLNEMLLSYAKEALPCDSVEPAESLSAEEQSAVNAVQLRWRPAADADSDYQKGYHAGIQDALGKSQAVRVEGGFFADIVDLLPNYGTGSIDDMIENAAVVARDKDGLFYLPFTDTAAQLLNLSDSVKGKTYFFLISAPRDTYLNADDTLRFDFHNMLRDGDRTLLVYDAREADASEKANPVDNIRIERLFRNEREDAQTKDRRGSLLGGTSVLRDGEKLYFNNESNEISISAVTDGSAIARMRETGLLTTTTFRVTDGERIYQQDAEGFKAIGDSEYFLTFQPAEFGVSERELQEIGSSGIVRVTKEWYFVNLHFTTGDNTGGDFDFWYNAETRSKVITVHGGDQEFSTNYFAPEMIPAADGSAVYLCGEKKIVRVPLPAKMGTELTTFEQAANGAQNIGRWAYSKSTDEIFWYSNRDNAVYSISGEGGSVKKHQPDVPMLSIFSAGDKLYGISADDTAQLLRLDPATDKTEKVTDLTVCCNAAAEKLSGSEKDEMRSAAANMQFLRPTAAWDDLIVMLTSNENYAAIDTATGKTVLIHPQDDLRLGACFVKVSGKTVQLLNSACLDAEDCLLPSRMDYDEEKLSRVWEKAAKSVQNDPQAVKGLFGYMLNNSDTAQLAAMQIIEEIYGVQFTDSGFSYMGCRDFLEHGINAMHAAVAAAEIEYENGALSEQAFEQELYAKYGLLTAPVLNQHNDLSLLEGRAKELGITVQDCVTYAEYFQNSLAVMPTL